MTTPFGRGSPWRATGLGLLLAGTAAGTPLHAQDATTPWQFMQEVSGWFGSTWLEGPRIPTVRSTAGGALGVGVQRRIRSEFDAGFMVRAALQPIGLDEAGATWQRGTLRELNLLGTLSLVSGSRGRTQLRLDGLGGIAVLSGLGNLLPFRDAGSIAPLGEVGIAVGRAPLDDVRRPRHYTGFARVGMLRLGTTPGNAIITPGWVNRLVIGVRTGR